MGRRGIGREAGGRGGSTLVGEGGGAEGRGGVVWGEGVGEPARRQFRVQPREVAVAGVHVGVVLRGTRETVVNFKMEIKHLLKLFSFSIISQEEEAAPLTECLLARKG
jgi:hypothetical protein